MRFDLIVENGIIVTADARGSLFPMGVVCVKDGEILFAGPPEKAPAPLEASSRVDARGGIVMPGLVNSHTHAPMSLFRGLADDLPLETWLNEHMFPAEAAHINPEAARLGALLSCGEMLLSGTTCFCGGYFQEDSVAQAVMETGMRAVLGHGIIDYPAPGVPDPAQNVAHAASFAKKWLNASPLLSPSLFCHAPYTCSAQTIIRAKEAARDMDILFQIHAAETRSEFEQSMAAHGLTPIQHLDKLGVLDEKTLLAHGVWVTREDLEILADRNAAVSVTTHSEMKLASGVAPIPDYLKAGVRLGLGTDGPASNNNQDMFSEMDMTAKIHKALSRDPTEMNAAQVLALATRLSAGAIGLGRVTGSLESEKRADIVILESGAPNMTPVYHPESAIVYAAAADNVKHVFVEGKQLVKDKRLCCMDMDSIMKQARALARTIG